MGGRVFLVLALAKAGQGKPARNDLCGIVIFIERASGRSRGSSYGSDTPGWLAGWEGLAGSSGSFSFENGLCVLVPATCRRC